MNIEIQFVHAKKSDALKEEINRQIDRLYEKYGWITNAAVFLKEEKHSGGKDFECEIRLSVPGPQIFAKSHETNFNKAINKTIRELSVQLEKKKEKFQEKR
jgi:putative sigma-54 modulation protein